MPENKDLRAKEMGQKSVLETLPHEGSAAVPSSNHFMEKLIEIGGFSKILEESNHN